MAEQITTERELLYGRYFTLPVLGDTTVDSIYHQKTAFGGAKIAPVIPVDKNNMTPLEKNVRLAIDMNSEGKVRWVYEEFPINAVTKIFSDLPDLNIGLQKRILFYFRNRANVMRNLRDNQYPEVRMLVARTAILNNLANAHDYGFYIKHAKMNPELREKMMNDLVAQAKSDIKSELNFTRKPEQIIAICNCVLDCAKSFSHPEYDKFKETDFNPNVILGETVVADTDNMHVGMRRSGFDR